MTVAADRHGTESVWHDAECGAYAADLPLWRRLAAESDGPVLDLGAGTGRVSLALAADGHEVIAMERERGLLRALAVRSRAGALPAEVRGLCADALEPWDGGLRDLGLILAPMQFMQLLGGRRGRGALLGSAHAALAPGGVFAAAVLDDREPLGSGAPEPLPDIREHGGWVHSSLPTAVTETADGIEIHRLRQLVSPRGALTERPHVVRLDHLSPATLEAEAAGAGFVPRERIDLGPTDEHVGSVVVVLEPRR